MSYERMKEKQKSNPFNAVVSHSKPRHREFPYRPPSPMMRHPGNNGMQEPVRVQMETAFDTDFSNVTIHPNSAKAAKLDALAYTQGHDIHFAPGTYKPDTDSGRLLLGHELAHVVQQREGRVSPTHRLKGVRVNEDPRLEQEADQMGTRASRSRPDGLDSTYRADVPGTAPGVPTGHGGEAAGVLQRALHKGALSPHIKKMTPDQKARIMAWNAINVFDGLKGDELRRSVEEHADREPGAAGGVAPEGATKSRAEKVKEKFGDGKKKKQGAKEDTSFPHKGKHCPPHIAVGEPKLLVRLTTGGDPALYISNDGPTVRNWEQEARDTGLIFKYTGETVHWFDQEIGSDSGEMTHTVRIDGDHGHPIVEFGSKTSFENYVRRGLETARKNNDEAEIAKIRQYLEARGFHQLINKFKL